MPDLDGDGIADLIVGHPMREGGEGDRVDVFAGASGELIRFLENPVPDGQDAFGWTAAGVPDLDGDGLGDVFVGAPSRDDNTLPGHAYLFSGGTGTLLYDLTSPDSVSSDRFGSLIAVVPDIDGDGLADLLVSLGDSFGFSQNYGHRVHQFSGATGDYIRTLLPPPGACRFECAFGVSMAGVPDINGDGRAEVLVGNPDDGDYEQGSAHLFDGASGLPISTLTDSNSPDGGGFGTAVAGVSDLDGDGRGEYLIGRPGVIYLFSGTGAVLRMWPSPPSKLIGSVITPVSDMDDDGLGDFLFGCPLADTDYVTDSGCALVYSSGTGRAIRLIEPPSPNARGHFGWSVTGLGDFNGDGWGDIAVGAPGEFGQSGRVYVYSGATLRPMNDDPTDAHRLWFDYFSSGANLGATPGTDEPDPSCSDGGDGTSIWWALVPPADATVTISTQSSDHNTVLSLYDASLSTEIACNDDRSASNQTSVIRDVPVQQGETYYVRVAGYGVMESGFIVLYAERGPPPVGIEHEEPHAADLSMPSPNPAWGAVALDVTLARTGSARVEVLDGLGRRVALLHDGPLSAGHYALWLDASSLTPGVYVARLTAGEAVVTRRFVVVR